MPPCHSLGSIVLIHILRSMDEVNLNNFKKGLHGVKDSTHESEIHTTPNHTNSWGKVLKALSIHV